MPLDRVSAVVSFGRNVFATFRFLSCFVHYMAPLIGRENCLPLGSGELLLVGTVFLSFSRRIRISKDQDGLAVTIKTRKDPSPTDSNR